MLGIILLLALLLAACSDTPSITIPTRAPTVPATAASPPSSKQASPSPASPVAAVAASPTRSSASPTARQVIVPSSSPPASPAAKAPGQVVVPAAPAPSSGQASPSPSQLVGPIKIVSSLPRGGSNERRTDSMVMAIRMALDEVGRRIEGASIVYEDWDDASPEHGAWDAEKEANNANRAVADPDVMVYIGPYNSGAAKVSIPILNQADLVMIGPSASYPGLTRPGAGEPNEPSVYYPTGRRNYARVVLVDDVQGTVGAAWAKRLGASRVYVLHDTEVYGLSVATAFAEAAGRNGLELVGGPEGIDRRARDFQELANRVRAANPDLVYFGGLTDNNAGYLFRDLRAVLGEGVKLMGPDGLYQQGFLDEAGDGAAGAFITFGMVAPSKLPGTKAAEWYRNYKVRFNAEPEVYAAYAYEATKVALDAIRRAGRKDRNAIREAVLATKEFEGILGRWSFDANGDTTLRMVSGREVKRGMFDDAGAVTLRGDGP